MILLAVRFLTLSFASKAIGKLLYFGAALIVGVLLIGAPILGILTNPLAPFWLSGKTSIPVAGGPADIIPVDLFPVTVPITGPITVPAGGVSDVQRYLLAIGANFSPAEAVIATAISIAEDGSGNPSAISGRNFDGSVDQGLWQVNSGWNARFGGQAALLNPVTNAIAARYIYGVQGWCAWSTYEASCGAGHNSAYRAYMNRATAAAQGGR